MSSWKRRDVADSYLEGVRGAIPLIAEQIHMMHRLIDATLPAVRSLVDLGCGDGALAANVLDRHPQARAWLVDFSEEMLKHARRRFERHPGMVTVVNSDFSDGDWQRRLELPEAPELVVSSYAIHHLSDERKRALYAEIFDLLAPGGLFINLEHVAPASELGRALFDELFIDLQFALARQSDPDVSRERIASQYHGREDRHDNILAPAEEQCRWLRECGFVDVDCYFKVLELALLAGRRP